MIYRYYFQNKNHPHLFLTVETDYFLENFSHRNAPFDRIEVLQRDEFGLETILLTYESTYASDGEKV